MWWNHNSVLQIAKVKVSLIYLIKKTKVFSGSSWISKLCHLLIAT